uniref:Uncharacterized protein n=1 Tax=Kalanchoe fedtschenkoi TaxID=63787 RepID=A0A7N0V4W0_KALFE
MKAAEGDGSCEARRLRSGGDPIERIWRRRSSPCSTGWWLSSNFGRWASRRRWK